jgi:hypothetical protein
VLGAESYEVRLVVPLQMRQLAAVEGLEHGPF